MSDPFLKDLTRRHFFNDCGVGLGRIGLASALAGGFNNLLRGSVETPFAPRQTHFAPKAKRVVYLFMAGAPSQLELFDNKPKLAEFDGKPLPKSVTDGARLAFIQPDAAVMSPRFPFAKYGQSGAEISNQLPHIASIADKIAIVRSMHTEQFNHSPAQIFLNTGHTLPGRPSLGSWLSYGIGSEATDLPSFVVLKGGGNVSGGAAMWGAGFLPGSHAGVPFRSSGDPILHVSSPTGIDDQAQRDSLDLIRSLNQQELTRVGDPAIQTRIDAYEMAWRMQSAAPELMDFGQESESTLSAYGAKPGASSYANNCLLARRLLERGTRFVQVYHSGWDHHSNVEGGVKRKAKEVDQATAALINDLDARGMLDDTLVIWGGEFGRTPMVEASAALGRSMGRDHHPAAFTMFFAGGGIKPGITIGETDELGMTITEDPVHIHDLHATILHLLGVDHEKLTYRFQGRDFRLTDVHGHVVKKLLV